MWKLYVIFSLGTFGLFQDGGVDNVYTANVKCKSQKACEDIAKHAMESNLVAMSWITDPTGKKIPESILYYH